MNCPKCSTPVASNAPNAGGPWATAAAPGLISRVKNILLTPKTEWPVIAAEPTLPAQLFIGYVAPLAALTALMALLRWSVIGVSIPFGGRISMPLTTGLTYAVMSLVSVPIMVFLVALIINGLAPTFAGQRDQRQALKVAAYSFTPAMLGSVLALSPILATLLQLLAGLYGIYVLYLGLPVVMRAPQDKAVGYTASVVICTILLGVVFVAVSSALHIGMGRSLMGSMSMGATPAERALDQAAARDQGAAILGNTVGNMLGTDAQGKAGLSAAISNLAKAGEQMQKDEARAAAQAPAPTPAQAAADAAQSTQSGLAATGGLLTALGGALGGPQRVETVNFKTLTAMLPPSVPGMQRTQAQGENQGAIGVTTSSANADYAGRDGSRVHVDISDMSGVSGLMDLAGALVQNTTSESDTGYEKDVAIGGRSVHEKYDTRNKHGELSVILAKRFTVEVSGTDVDMSMLEQTLGQVDLARLESMKDAGSQAK